VLLFTCLALVLVVVAFVAVWLTLPSGHTAVRASSVDYPARLFRYGAATVSDLDCSHSSDPFCSVTLTKNEEALARADPVSPQTMKNHALVFFGGLAGVVLLLGIAFGAASRRNVPPSAVAQPPS
jgi:hypothetical protein